MKLSIPRFHAPDKKADAKAGETGEQSADKKKFSIKNFGMEKFLYLLLAGVALVILFMPPTDEKSEETKTMPQAMNPETLEVTEDTYERLLETRLSDLLGSVAGVGKTQVMITLKSTGEKIVLMERPFTRNSIAETDSEGGSRNSTQISQSETTVYIEASDGSKIPYVVKELEPSVEGVVVIAEGGDRMEVVQNIMDAVTALFDVPSHKVKVMKMK